MFLHHPPWPPSWTTCSFCNLPYPCSLCSWKCCSLCLTLHALPSLLVNPNCSSKFHSHFASKFSLTVSPAEVGMPRCDLTTPPPPRMPQYRSTPQTILLLVVYIPVNLVQGGTKHTELTWPRSSIPSVSHQSICITESESVRNGRDSKKPSSHAHILLIRKMRP